MHFMKKYGFHFLLIAVVADFLTPYVLGIFYPKLNQLTAVMSLFGEVGSPVRQAFLIWSVVAGIFYTLSMPAIYTTLKTTSKSLASLATIAIGSYGIGDCIFTGIFSIDTAEAQWNLSTWVHNLGSGIGYAGFLPFPLFLYLIYKKRGDRSESRHYLILLLLSLAIAAIYGLARIPQLNQFTAFRQLGLWQRISFIFNYLPIVRFAWSQIKKNPVNR